LSKELHSLYIHFPYCKSHCNYCDFYSELGNSPSNLLLYGSSLARAWEKQGVLFKEHDYVYAPLKTLYLGGGTPSLWGKSGVRFFQKLFLENKIKFAKNYEWTLEMNPGAYEQDILKEFEALGLNRYSVGVQTCDSDLLKILGRTHSVEESRAALEFLKGKNFSIDLMLGLPFSEGKRRVLDELKELLEFGPTHLSVYILTVDENYPYYKNLPSEEWIEKEYLLVSEFLTEHGFLHYEVSNFAREGFEAQHNLQYWKSESVAALGPSATGLLVHEKTAIRYKWDEGGNEYLLESLDEDALKLEKFYMRFRTNLGISFNDFFKVEDQKIFEEICQAWHTRGLISVSQKGIFLTAQGFLILDSLMNELFFKIKSL